MIRAFLGPQLSPLGAGLYTAIFSFSAAGGIPFFVAMPAALSVWAADAYVQRRLGFSA